jgi:hypothetical protein
LLNNQKEVLAAYPFKASFQYSLELDFLDKVKRIQTDAIPFHLNIPDAKGTAFIQIRNPKGTSIGSIAVSPNSPKVTILYPNGGEAFPIGSEIKSCWQGVDQDGDDLTYLLAYSQNGGVDWIPIASELNETCHTWTTKGIPPGDHYMLKVIATDGANTGADKSDATFALLNPLLPGDFDCDRDVDGMDLLSYIKNNHGIELTEFAKTFGKVDDFNN